MTDPAANPAVPEVIDAHHHLWPVEAVPDQVWQPPVDTLRRAFEPADLRGELASAGVTGTVLMQSVDDAAENERLLAYASADFVRGVVAWAPPDRPAEAHRVLDGLLERRDAGAPVVGVRSLVGTDPMTWATQDDVLALFRRLADAGLAWDVVPVTAPQRDAVVQVAQQVPELRVVVDHLAAPPPGGDRDALRAWRSALGQLAACPGVAVKLSVGVAVLTAADRWDADEVAVWVDSALDAFGPERSMAASNWPVVLLRTGYVQAWADVTRAVVPLAPTEAAAVLGGTASRWYGLDRWTDSGTTDRVTTDRGTTDSGTTDLEQGGRT